MKKILLSIKILLNASCLLVGLNFGQAQEIKAPTVNIASPNSASLGKFVDIPVNYHTGIPSISIPIYTVQEGPIKMPISVDYHASGLKVMEQASWVGAGWTLSTGGVITRTVRGNADEQLRDPGPDGVAQTSYMHNNGYYNYLYNSVGDPDYINFSNGVKDGEPDLFFFNFNGYSGKFYFRADGSPVLIPQQDVVIKPIFCEVGTSGCLPSTGEQLRGWTITTPDGIKYSFGETANADDVNPFEKTSSVSPAGDATYPRLISSWYLYKVESPDGRFEVDLKYESESYGFYGLSLHPVLGFSGSGIQIVKNIIYGVRLKEITFSNGVVKFIPDTNPRQDLSSATSSPTLFHDVDNTNAMALKQIQIVNNTSVLKKSFDFEYSYFVSDKPLNGTYGTGINTLESMYKIHTDKKRLKLNSIRERTDDNVIANPPHIFSYYDELSVPRTLSLAQDHWGFYNGADNNTELIPSLSTDDGNTFNVGYGANRDAMWPAMRAGTLSRIQYPTGGHTDFSFGNHRVFVEKLTTTENQLAYKSETLHRISSKYSFTVTTATSYKLFVNVPNGGDGGVASVDYLNSNGTIDLSRSMTQGRGTYIFTLTPGNYEFYVTSYDNTSYRPIEGTLYQLTPYMGWQEAPVGGLRIEKLSFNDGVRADALYTTYSYEDEEGVAQGVLFSRPNYIALAKNDNFISTGILTGTDANGYLTFHATDGCIKTDTEGNNAYFISPSNIHPMQTTQGGHFGYNRVKVSQPDGGYMVYKYKLSQNQSGDVCVRKINKRACDADAPSYPPAPEPHDFSRGELRSVAVYNSTGKILTENRYETTYVYEPVGVTGLSVNFSAYFNSNLITEYELKTAKKTKTVDLELIYNANDAQQPPQARITEVYFNSTNHALPTKSTISDVVSVVTGTTSLSELVRGTIISEVVQTYVGDIVPSSCATGYTCDQTLQNSLAQFLVNYNSTLGSCGSLSCKFSALKAYWQSVNDARKNYVTCRGSYTTNSKACMNDLYSSANPEFKAILDLRSLNQVALEIETSSWRAGKFLSSASLLYKDYEGDRKSIYPNQLMTALADPQTNIGFTKIAFDNTSLLRDNGYSVEQSFQYSMGKLVQATGKDGLVTSYLWNPNRNFPIAKAIGTTYFSLNAAYSSKGLANIRIDSGLAKAMVTTYTYDPLVGITSQTDPNAIVEYYEYDKLGRLRFVRDKDQNIVKEYRYDYYKR